MTEKTVTVTQVRSAIGARPEQRGTLRALGLRRIGARRAHVDSPSFRGQVARVRHLVEVTDSVEEDS